MFVTPAKVVAKVVKRKNRKFPRLVKNPASLIRCGVEPGGDEGTRTPGLLHAKQALYQLSYIPTAIGLRPCADTTLGTRHIS